MASAVPDGNPGGVEGPAVFANHHNDGSDADEWYLFHMRLLSGVAA